VGWLGARITHRVTLTVYWVLGGNVMGEASREGGSGAGDGSLTALETKVNELGDRIAEEKPWKLGPLRVKGAVDVIALITFVIAIGNITFTLWDYFSAADIVAFPPKAHPVVPGSSTYGGGGRNLKRGWVSSF
jgi:hypothetical protein